MGGAAAVVHVGGGTGDGARCGDAAEENGADVAHALRYELHVASVVRADHAVGHHAGEQRLNGGEHGDGEAVGKLIAEQLGAQLGDVELGKGAADGVQVADGVHVHAQQVYHADAHEDGNERAGYLLAEFRPHEQDHQAHYVNQHRFGVDGGDVLHDGQHLIGGFHCGGAGRVAKAEQILDLSDDDGYRDAGGETGGYGVGHEADKRAQLEHAHQDKHDARDDGGGEKAVEPVGGHDAGDDGGECRRGA